jgi:hypothetical protein
MVAALVFVGGADAAALNATGQLAIASPVAIGEPVAVGSDALFVGAPAYAGGVVFAFPARGINGEQSPTAELAAPALTLGDLPAQELAASGATVVAGGANNALEVFTEPTGGWQGNIAPAATLMLPSLFEIAAIATDGSTVAVIGYDGLINPNTSELELYTQPAGGWSGTLTAAKTISVPQTATGDSVAIAGGVLVTGGTADASGSTIVTGGPGEVFPKPPAGWASLSKPAATLMPFPGDFGRNYVFVKPPGGWRGVLRPAARLQPGGGTAISSSGTMVAAAGVTQPSKVCPCAGGVRLFAEPSGGWHGLLTAPIAATAVTPQSVNLGLAFAGPGALLFGGQAIVTPPGDPYAYAVRPYTTTGIFALAPPFPETQLPIGAASVTGASLTVAGTKPRIAFRVHAGTNTLPVHTLTITPPAGLHFAQGVRALERGVTATIPGLGAAALRVRAGRLVITYTSPATEPAIPVTLTAPALTITPGLRHRLNAAAHEIALTTTITVSVFGSPARRLRFTRRVH